MTGFLTPLLSVKEPKNATKNFRKKKLSRKPFGSPSVADCQNKSYGTAAACGGAPHQSGKCFGHFPDSFSPRGEALVVTSALQQQKDCARHGTKASPSREKLSENRLFGTDFLTDVGVRRRRRSRSCCFLPFSANPNRFQSRARPRYTGLSMPMPMAKGRPGPGMRTWAEGRPRAAIRPGASASSPSSSQTICSETAATAWAVA